MLRLTGTTARTVLCIVALNLGTQPRHGRADPAETGRRLREAGVEELLRVRIEAAIARGVGFLKASQAADGSFRDRWRGGRVTSDREPVVTTLLCALALRHAAGAEAEALARRALAWALAQPQSVDARVDCAGLALRVLHAVQADPPRALALARSLGEAIDDASGYWGDELQGGPYPGLRGSEAAAMGLAAARRMGIEVSPEVWRRHARALCAEQTRTGSWRWHATASLTAWGHPPDPRVDTGPPVCRFIGLSNLMWARAWAGSKGAERAKIDATIDKARSRLSKDVAWVLDDPAEILTTLELQGGRELRVRSTGGSSGVPGTGAYHTLVALAQACLLADIATYERPIPRSRRVERRSWYTDGAQWLLRVQDGSGGWSPTAGDPVTSPSEGDTAYALLFLLRAPSTLHPTAAPPIDAGAAGAGAPVPPK